MRSKLALSIHWQFNILDRAVDTKNLVKMIVVDIFGQFFDDDLDTRLEFSNSTGRASFTFELRGIGDPLLRLRE